MRNSTSAILSGVGVIALLLAATPNPAAARGGFGGFGGGGFRGGSFAGGHAMAMGGFRGGAIARPGWGGAVRPGWGGGWRGGGWGWGWPVAAGIAAGAALTAPWGYYGYPYGTDCTYWNGFGWVNTCYGAYGYGW
jgi:hypothetical protein